MPSYEFQNLLHRTLSDMLDNVASAYLSAGGLNNYHDQREALAASSNKELAVEAISGWGLHVTDEDDRPCHMRANGYKTADLAAAFVRLRERLSALTLYRVTEGEAVPAEQEDEDGFSYQLTAGEEGIMVLASCEDEALELAVAYDEGRIQPDNVAWQDDTIVALRSPVTI